MARFCLRYAWLLWIPLQAGTLPAATRYFDESVRPVLACQAGFIETQFLSDPVRSRCLVVVLWASQVHSLWAEGNHVCQTVLQQMETYFAGQPTMARCEVMGQIA